MFSVFVPDHPSYMSEFLMLLNPLSIPELHIPKYLRIFFSITLPNFNTRHNSLRQIENILIKAVWQNTKGNEEQEPTALQLSSCPAYLEYRISKNKLSGHHTE